MGPPFPINFELGKVVCPANVEPNNSGLLTPVTIELDVVGCPATVNFPFVGENSLVASTFPLSVGVFAKVEIEPKDSVVAGDFRLFVGALVRVEVKPEGLLITDVFVSERDDLLAIDREVGFIELMLEAAVFLVVEIEAELEVVDFVFDAEEFLIADIEVGFEKVDFAFETEGFLSVDVEAILEALFIVGCFAMEVEALFVEEFRLASVDFEVHEDFLDTVRFAGRGDFSIVGFEVHKEQVVKFFKYIRIYQKTEKKRMRFQYAKACIKVLESLL
ncbi:hypothetical protein G9A89_020766 [Geosiphon pyriformis]|nr:hypothetical protein G9A89_020766 [Geosiphon pyriformis]